MFTSPEDKPEAKVFDALPRLFLRFSRVPDPPDSRARPDVPPPNIAGVTKFLQVVTAVPSANTEVPPAVIWGVTKFPETVVADDSPPDSTVPQPVIWVRFGVTKEAAEREMAEAARLPKIAGEPGVLSR